MTLAERKKGLLAGSLLGDAFVLGAHWIYDPERIRKEFGRYDRLHEPLADTYHIGKHLGDQTHYGDQTAWLFRHLRDSRGHTYDPDAWRQDWLAHMETYTGYRDAASRTSAARLRGGERYGSDSNELGGAARIAPVLYWLADPGEILSAALDQSRATHDSLESRLATELFTRAALRLVSPAGEPFGALHALESARADMHAARLDTAFLDQAAAKALPYAKSSPERIARELGQSCHAQHAVPVLYAVFETTEDYREALSLHASIGGDSATRAMLTGVLLGAASGTAILPPEWLGLLSDPIPG